MGKRKLLKRYMKLFNRLGANTTSLSRSYFNDRLPRLLTILAFALLGSYLLIHSFAASLTASFQSEDGTKNGSVLLADATASGGKGILFGSGGTVIRYEAEDADHNVTPFAKANASPAGNGFVLSNFGDVGKYVTFTVSVPADGNYVARLGYTGADTTVEKFNPFLRTLAINGSVIRTLDVPRTSLDGNMAGPTVDLDLQTIPLSAGDNAVTFRVDTTELAYWHVDYLDVVGGSGGTNPTPLPPPPIGTFSAYKQALLDKMDGFAKVVGTTGGNAATSPTLVTTTADSGAGSLREALSSGNRWIIFDKSTFPANQEKLITINSKLPVASNTTIDGRGSQVRVSSNAAYGFELGDYCFTHVSNVIIHNIKTGPSPAGNQTGDHITINPNSDKIWIDHVEFITPTGDEALSILHCNQEFRTQPGRENLMAPMNATFSFLKFDNFSCSFNGHNFPLLIGDGSYSGAYVTNPQQSTEHNGVWERQPNPDQLIKVTLHDTYLSNVCYRGPLIYDSRVHIWNNYVTGNYGHTPVEFSNVSNILYEESVLNRGSGSVDEVSFRVGRFDDTVLGYLPAPRLTLNNALFLGGATQQINKDPNPAFTPPYAYTPLNRNINTDNGAALLSRLNDSNTSNVNRSGWVNIIGWQ